MSLNADRSGLSPSYLTSKSTLFFLAKAGIKEAVDTAKHMQMDLDVDLEHRFDAAIAMEEFLYVATNELIKKAGNKSVLEFPCGYSARGVKLSAEGFDYVGADTSVIAETMGLTKLEMIEEGTVSEKANYHFTNINLTNYASITAAASLLEGPITIVTQGVMSWLTMDKKLMVIDHIRTLLAERGGCWIMADVDSNVLAGKIFNAAGRKKKKKTRIRPASVNKLNLDTVNWESTEEMEKSMEKLGFKAEIVHFPGKLPYLNSLEAYEDPVIRRKIADEMSRYNIMMFTADDSYEEEMNPEAIDFSVFMAVFGTTLQITICGNLTTATAPILLEKFEKVKEEGGFTEIDVDFSYVPMIDPAGLRALLVMKRSIGDKIIRYGDMNDAVKEVFNATGFSDVLD